jgi:hypothetical protein
MPAAPLSRQQKLFKMDALLPLDANNLDVDEAVTRLLVYLRTNGRQIRTTSKPPFMDETPDAETPKAVIAALVTDGTAQIQGLDDPVRRELISNWLESHFALMSRRGKSAGGDYRMGGLRPLHFNVIKLFNPKVKRQDRYLSDWLFNVIHDDRLLYANPDSLFKRFFGAGVKFFGDSDLRIDEAMLKTLAAEGRLDIELLFLLRLTEPFDVDKFTTKAQDQVVAHSFVCPEQVELMREDLGLLFLYKDQIPRRELINYMTTLMVFHAALYFFQVVRIANHAVAKGELPQARGACPKAGEARHHAPFELALFCDLTNGHDPLVKALSEACYQDLFKEVERYFRSGYTLRKLEEFAASYLSPAQKKQTGKHYLGLLLEAFRQHEDLNGYFNRDINDVIQAARDPDSGSDDPDIARVIEVCNQRKLDKLDTFVEILLHFQYGTLRDQHRKLIAGLCGIDQERGFLAGKGRVKRRFVLGNELLEVLIQLAVLRQRQSDAYFETHPIQIQDFVDWLAGRYGLLIDRLGPDAVAESEEVNRALARNYGALKTRLRQLGFFVDLADASNSQVIEPRFAITGAELAAA